MMRRPRDLDTDLKTLDERARVLRARKLTQLGELVIACKADVLPVEFLAGALLDAAGTKDFARQAAWHAQGAAFFRTKRRGRDAGAAASDNAVPAASPADTPSSAAPDAESTQ